MKRPGILFFFILPFAGMLMIFFILSALNRGAIRTKAEQLVREQLVASAQILKAGIKDALEEGIPPQGLLRRYAGEKNIYFLALLDGRREVVDWVSRFEGYLPVSRKTPAGPATWTISSPAGVILNILTPLTLQSGETFELYLGYSLRNLEQMVSASRRTFYLFFSILAAVGLVLFRGIYALHRTSLAKAEEAVAARKEKERFEAISGFTAGVAHEIRNPLNSLALLLEIVRKKAPAQLEDDIELGRGEVQKISRIIDLFSDAVKPLRLHREECSLRDVFAAVERALERESLAKNVPIRYTQKGETLLSADKNLLGQAFMNIVRNALEATEQGSVDVSVGPKDHGYLVRVEDSGRGIPEEDFDRIFKPFYSTKATGLGIGLFLAEKIIAAHGGTIAVSSRTGRGTVISIELPKEGS